jgi:RNA polymerase sigma factor (sigma-70 family)
VCYPASFHIEYRTFIVSENSSLQDYEHRRKKYEWTDDEITTIRNVLRRLTAVRIMNPNDAEDLVQDTLLTMIMKHPGCELKKGNLVWSMGILRKKVGNYYRRTQRNASLDSQEISARQWDHPSATAASPEWKVFHEELQQIVRQALPRLPSSQRRALELLLDGCEPGEIVRKLHPERYQNVINRLHRGRKKLAKELAKYGYGPYAKNGVRKMKRSGIAKAKRLKTARGV